MGARSQADCVTRSVLVTPGYAEVGGKREVVKHGCEIPGGLRNSIGPGKVRRSETQILTISLSGNLCYNPSSYLPALP